MSAKTKPATHTPAPWVVREDGQSYVVPIIDSPNVGKRYWASLATVTQRDPHPTEGGGISLATAYANARLIAAAPDLLEHLETLLAIVENEFPTSTVRGLKTDEARAMEAARAVIKRARGEGCSVPEVPLAQAALKRARGEA